MERKRSSRRGYPARRRKPLGEKIKDFLRNFVAFMFSNVGIIGLVVGYTIVGALIFQRIEGENQVDRLEDVSGELNATADRLWNITCCGLLPLDEHVWRNEVTTLVLSYQMKYVKALKDSGYDSAKSTDNWSFSGAFLYSLTVITTIGYGNVTPRSEWGKITTVLYAIIGMPLFLLYLSNIGDILAKSFKWTYAKLWLCRGCPGARRRRMLRAMHQGRGVRPYPPPPAVDYGDNHSWTPGAHPAMYPTPGRRLGVPGVPGMLGVPGAPPEATVPPWIQPWGAYPGPRPYNGNLEAAPGFGEFPGTRRRPQHYPKDDDQDVDSWRHRRAPFGGRDWQPTPRAPHSPRTRKVGVDYGHGLAPGLEQMGPYEYQRGAADRTPASELNSGWAGSAGSAGLRTPRGRSADLNERWDDEDLELGYRAPRAKQRGRKPRPGARRQRRRLDVPEDDGEEDASSEDVSEELVDDEEEEEEDDDEDDETPSTDEEEDEEYGDDVHDEDDDDDDDEGEMADADTDGESSSASSESYDPQTVTVPVTLCLAIMVGYVCGGAVLFSKWEEWDMLDGSYFCFISLSTIGFGDIVPGGTVYSDNIEVSFIFCSMYLMLGMALIAMCFNLMQEEVIHKMRSCIRTLRYVTRCNRRRAAAAGS